MSAARRILKEMKDMEASPVDNCTAGPVDPNNIYNWKGTIIGPEKSPYEGGLFQLEIVFPMEYPFKPPKVASCVAYAGSFHHQNLPSKYQCEWQHLFGYSERSVVSSTNYFKG